MKIYPDVLCLLISIFFSLFRFGIFNIQSSGSNFGKKKQKTKQSVNFVKKNHVSNVPKLNVLSVKNIYYYFIECHFKLLDVIELCGKMALLHDTHAPLVCGNNLK